MTIIWPPYDYQMLRFVCAALINSFHERNKDTSKTKRHFKDTLKISFGTPSLIKMASK